jgi:hypothetical protein
MERRCGLSTKISASWHQSEVAAVYSSNCSCHHGKACAVCAMAAFHAQHVQRLQNGGMVLQWCELVHRAAAEKRHLLKHAAVLLHACQLAACQLHACQLAACQLHACQLGLEMAVTPFGALWTISSHATIFISQCGASTSGALSIVNKGRPRHGVHSTNSSMSCARHNLSSTGTTPNHELDNPFAEGQFRYVAKGTYTNGPRWVNTRAGALHIFHP